MLAQKDIQGQLTHSDRDSFEKRLEEVWKPEMEKCKLIPDFDEKIYCMSEVVHGITRAQDIANLTVYGAFFKEDPQASQDSRWESILLLDDANAVFLGVTDYRYDPEFYMRSGYVESKADSFKRRWNNVKWGYKDLKKRSEADRKAARKHMEKQYGKDWNK